MNSCIATPDQGVEESWAIVADDQILRSESYSVEHLEQHSLYLARLFKMATKSADDGCFTARFAKNANFLRQAYASISDSIQVGEPLTPDAEWILDNFYIVEEQLREIREDLPDQFYRELPKLTTGEPRVYALAIELITHTDSALDEERIIRFVREFQTITPLSIGEVWAVPIMLRLGLVENLRRLSAQMLAARRCRFEAQEILDIWKKRGELTIDLSSLERCAPLVLKLLTQMQEKDSPFAGGLKELERRLTEHNLSAHDAVHFEHQRQAANQVSIGNVITSMRLISALDWVLFFEQTNLAEQVLRQDPAEVYPRMDFETRDRYRHAVEELAKRTKLTDIDVAERTVALAQQTESTAQDHWQQRHVGYWLVDRGRVDLEKLLSYKPPLRQRFNLWLLRHPNSTYFCSVGFLTALGVSAAALGAMLFGASLLVVFVICLLAILPASELAVSLVNLAVTSWLKPRLLPKLEFKEGIPSTYPTMVVVPAMLTNPREVESLVSRLEMHYLTNPEAALRFALLTDFSDAPQHEMSEDSSLVKAAIGGIRELNRRYGEETGGPFYLFHRERRWNERERKWMGWERKRGKLMEFNQLLRGRTDTSYVVQEGDMPQLVGRDGHASIQFVITLDADTQLPHGVARKLIGALAHPLNRPCYDASRHLVTSGYGVLQPRVSVHLGSANKTWFSRIFADSPGIDPYTTCASDMYQDLFGEGSFTGKGIYDLDAFEKALDGVFPENQILSHDLIEGCHARVGLVSDIVLIDGFPALYEADAKRQHRWVRGDWQLLPWLFPKVPTATGWRQNPLTLLSRWKVFDNLRRSLVAPAVMALLVVGWMILPNGAALWTLAGLLILAFPLAAQIFMIVRGWQPDAPWWDHVQAVWRDLWRTPVQTVLAVAFLPHKAYFMLDAVVRTLTRMLVTRRRLLEWETAAESEKRLSGNRWASLLRMCYVPGVAIAVLCLINSMAWPAAAPLLLSWLVAPLLVFWIDRPIRRRTSALTTDQLQQLRHVTRRTWAFFEAYVGAQDHWLPPDNFQEYPGEKIAHRVSPTNQGLFLISGLVARDFGYISLHHLAQLWERNLESWEKFERLHGHFYNWYDTSTLTPLYPRYVSTVDSGNLAVCFLTLRQGVDDIRSIPVFGTTLWTGLLETIQLVDQSCNEGQAQAARLTRSHLEPLYQTLEKLRMHDMPEDLWGWRSVLEALHQNTLGISESAASLNGSREALPDEITTKVQCLDEWIAGMREDLRTLFGWVDVAARVCVRDRADLTVSPRLPWQKLDDGVQRAWINLWKILSDHATLDSLTSLEATAAPALIEFRNVMLTQVLNEEQEAVQAWLNDLESSIHSSARLAGLLNDRYEVLAQRMETLALEMDFRFLFNPQRRLFAIGFNVEEGKLDRAHYDMLCSEARLASYLAIAKGDAEPRHWFQLGRPLTKTAGEVALLSWGGTMFEYLMPPLFQRTYHESLLFQSYRAAVARQQEYARQHGVPWGISESAFGALAINSDYHYRSFGVPGLGLKRGLARDLVVSPYSTLLALEIDPAGAFANLEAITREGGWGHWGYYDSLDYSPERVPAGKRCIVVRCYMAHHQGMSLLALSNMLDAGRIRNRFHAHPLARATELLLQERVPVATPRFEPHADEVVVVTIPRNEEEMVSRRLLGVETAMPRTHLLSNGQYSVMTTSTGGGYSRCRDVAITRWRSDPTRDHWGQYLYLRDVRSNRVWSAAYQPTLVQPSGYEVIYSIDKAEFHRRDFDISSNWEVAVSPENNAEVRQLKLTNHGSSTREIEVTSYAEIALTTQQNDVAHPAFHKLFIETEYIPEETALIAKRRPRDSQQSPLWGVHVLAAVGEALHSVQYETSRQAFLGRGRTPQNPAALEPGVRLSGATGAVLDPIFAIRCIVRIGPNESATLGFATAMANSREEALLLADQYHDPRGVQRAFELAWAYSQVELRHIHLSPAMAHLYQRMAAAILYPDPSRRATEDVLLANRQGQAGLWRYGVSGDLPILLIHVTKPEHVGQVRELLAANEYWRAHGLKVDLVVLNDYPGSYLDAIHEQLVSLLNEAPRNPDERPGGVFLVRGAQIPREDKILLEAAASVVLHGDHGSLAQQMEKARPAVGSQSQAGKARSELSRRDSTGGRLTEPRRALTGAKPDGLNERQRLINQLEYWNGLGGFADNGKEYRILLKAGSATPMPWSTVLANPTFGCLLTESGGGYTWFMNSRENKLTSWCNDPIGDALAEALYIRDDETGELWSPLPAPIRDDGDYWIHHGQGYTRFAHNVAGIYHETLISIAANDPVKFIRLKLRNDSPVTRNLSLTYFVEWVLGVHREQTQLHVTTDVDADSGALLARNAYHPELSQQVAFLDVLGPNRSYSGDRKAFIGRNGTLKRPQALQEPSLNGRTGAGLDPCGAVQTRISLAAGKEAEVVFLLGSANDLTEAQSILTRYRLNAEITRSTDLAIAQWNQILGSVQVKTPNRALDLLVNRWLLYQTLSCRMWGRSGFYQSGGAYGFRDQLQDVMALVYSRPDIAREHLMRAASRQYEEGDVQHWWHPPQGRGTRTRFSDDYLWLPFVTCHYLDTTGDLQVLDEETGFLTSMLLEPEEHERYELPAVSSRKGSLYEHCRLAIDRGFRLGPHGLPLMGCGDWNDGMNKVGEQGQGESIWVGWFLLVLLRRFIPLMEARGDREAAADYQAKVESLRQALETHGWDGEWYRRAYFDNGVPLGSAQNDECQIDSIAQTWAVMANADPERVRMAMQAVLERLVKPKDQLVLLFAPPFDKTELDPGYIKGYLPGIRENGGQYTHPALWLIRALTLLGDGDQAMSIFDMINPAHHGRTPDAVNRYQVEPYVVAADVYGVAPHTGRGGWTWYTGSAAWMYRVAIESILGFELRGNRVRFRPCCPSAWSNFELTLRRGDTSWTFVVSSDGTNKGWSAEYELRDHQGDQTIAVAFP